MFGLQPQDWLIILIVALLLFGPDRLPKIARGLSKTLAQFRREMEGVEKSLEEASAPAPPTIPPKPHLPRPPWRIFLSSVIKDMAEERARVKQAVEALPGLAQAWMWEEGSYASPIKTPEEEYLPEVRVGHIFLLIIKDDVTAPVRKEYETARQLNKPMLVFVKNCERTPAAQAIVDEIGKELTYAVFNDSEELDPLTGKPDRLKDLDNQVRKAVAQLVIDKFEIDDEQRRALEAHIADLEKQIEESKQKIKKLEQDKKILKGAAIAGPVVAAAATAVALQATAQPPEPTPTPRIEVSTPTPPRPEPPSLFAPHIKRGRDGKRMILIPAGEFWRGTSDADEQEMKTRLGFGPWDDEKPQRKIYLDAYYIDETPVTNEEYQRFVLATGHRVPYGWNENWRTFPEGKGAHPVVNVNWDDANAYARWAGKRLPTEAEWEKAARGTDGRRYPWGNEFDSSRCNSWESGIHTTTPVGRYSPRGDSPYGVKDMAGNVWEWCADWYDENYYKNSPKENPKGPASGRYRVLRGGSWTSGSSNVRAANRDDNVPDLRDINVGFRCAQ
jgi:TatA/E family protein of Tat protein translocase